MSNGSFVGVKIPEVVDYLYSNSTGTMGLPANVGPRFGIACSDLKFMVDYCNPNLTIRQFRLHNKLTGGLMESDCGIVNSAYTAKHVRYVGLFDDESECSHAFCGVAKASLGAAKYRLYYGSAFRLITADEHKAFLNGYARGLALLEDRDDYHRTKSTIALLYHHAPFVELVGLLTSDALNFGNRKKYSEHIERILEGAADFKKKVL